MVAGRTVRARFATRGGAGSAGCRHNEVPGGEGGFKKEGRREARPDHRYHCISLVLTLQLDGAHLEVTAKSPESDTKASPLEGSSPIGAGAGSFDQEDKPKVSEMRALGPEELRSEAGSGDFSGRHDGTVVIVIQHMIPPRLRPSSTKAATMRILASVDSPLTSGCHRGRVPCPRIPPW
jgi:hypothetical protein